MRHPASSDAHFAAVSLTRLDKAEACAPCLLSSPGVTPGTIRKPVVYHRHGVSYTHAHTHLFSPPYCLSTKFKKLLPPADVICLLPRRCGFVHGHLPVRADGVFHGQPTGSSTLTAVSGNQCDVRIVPVLHAASPCAEGCGGEAHNTADINWLIMGTKLCTVLQGF